MTALNLKNTGTKIDMTVADTILRQIGGSRFVAMTGSCNFSSDGSMLQFNVKARNKIRCNAMRIELDRASDTYTVIFNKVSTPKMCAKTGKITGGIIAIKKIEGVTCDMLAKVFENTTGLYTSL